jgi:putative ABC transport system ATP-binding protein
MNTPLIQLDGITKVFLTDEVETHALSGIHLAIARRVNTSPSPAPPVRQIDAAIDPRPARHAHRWRLPCSTVIAVANLDFAQRARIRNREIGFIFQSFNLIGDLTVFENVELPLTYRGLSRGSERKNRRPGRPRAGGHVPPRQPLPLPALRRPAAARCRRPRPRRFPFHSPRRRTDGNLDSKNGDAVMELLTRVCTAKGATICMVTHDPRFARHADRTIHLFDGRVVEEREAETQRVKSGE